jgi:hypothetical protein
MSGVSATPLARVQAAHTDPTVEAVGAQERAVYYGEEADAAGSVGEPDGEHHETAERDADGRLPWQQTDEPETPAGDPRKGKDPSGHSGNFLDLTG